MALRPDRVEHLTDLSFFMNATAERGILVIQDGGGSGAAMDDSSATVKKASAWGADVVSGAPVGLLLNDVVNLDLTRQHINYAKDEMQQGGKVLLLRRGTVVTDQVSGTPAAGEKAHFVLTGQLAAASDSSSSPQVGRFLSSKDADGYAKVEINII
jgi:hypothetical protein